MNSILRIYVPLTLNVVAQHTKVLIVTLDLNLDISKQPTPYDHVVILSGLIINVNTSCEIYYSFDSCW